MNIEQTIKYKGKPNRKHFLNWWIKKHNIKTMTEVGVRDGRTTFHLLDNNPDLVMYAIDKSIKGFYNKEVQEKYGDRLRPFAGLSDYCAKNIPDNSQDLVFIDADHSYPWVCRDIKAYTPKVKKGGWLTGHDIDYEGVYKAVNELIVNYDIGTNNVWLKQL